MSPDVVNRPSSEDGTAMSGNGVPPMSAGAFAEPAGVPTTEPAFQPKPWQPVESMPSPTPVALEPAAQASMPSAAPLTPEPAALAPIPVVQVLSPRGVEYVFLTINLFAAALGLMGTLVALVNGKTDFDVLAYPVALLLVSVPLFAYFFLRLKKAELRNPALKQDPSKRRSTQFTQIVAYLTVFFSLISLVAAIFASMAGKFSGSLTKFVLDVVVLVVVAGGILAYYWHDERKVL